MLGLNKEQQLMVIGLALSLVIGLGVNIYRNISENREPGEIVTGKKFTARILVQVSGAVPNPGVYRLAAGERWLDAVAAAGGILPGGDSTGLNLSQVLKDGEQVLVPVRTSTPQPGSTSGGPKINLNTATIDQLDELPGVGKVLASKIVEYRQKNGCFSRLDDLQKIPRLKGNKYQRLKEQVTI